MQFKSKPKPNTMKSVPAVTVDNGDSIPKEGEATYGARQPISLQTAPTKRSRFLNESKIYERLADTQKVKPGR
jgi:hypothetical protein